MIFSFHPEARSGFISAIDYYEEIQSGLGIQLAEEIFASIERILQYPQSTVNLLNKCCTCSSSVRFSAILKIKTKYWQHWESYETQKTDL